MERKVSSGQMEILSVDDGGFAGLMITVIYRDLVLLDYFAIVPEKRGHGIGTAALELLRERYPGKRIFLEIELPADDTDTDKLRRKDFYLRAGLSCTGINVLLFGVPMELLAFGCDVDFDEYKTLYIKTFSPLMSFVLRPLDGKQV